MENREIERKFLVLDDSFRSLATSHHDIVQGYISRQPGRTIRIRLCTEADGTQQAFLTIKSRLTQMTRFEWERPISVEDFHALLPLCEGKYIDKTRYILPAQTPAAPASSTAEDTNVPHLKWEIDVFRHPNSGLVLAEIELPAEDFPFVRPAFLGEEVTTDPRYYNANML